MEIRHADEKARRLRRVHVRKDRSPGGRERAEHGPDYHAQQEEEGLDVRQPSEGDAAQAGHELHLKLCRSGEDYLRCALAAKFPSTFPTIYAEEDGQVVGVIGTSPERRAVVIGPLWCPKRPKVLRQLLDLYEVLLKAGGITLYFAHAPDPKWGHALVKHRGAVEVGDGWYRKQL